MNYQRFIVYKDKNWMLEYNKYCKMVLHCTVMPNVEFKFVLLFDEIENSDGTYSIVKPFEYTEFESLGDKHFKLKTKIFSWICSIYSDEDGVTHGGIDIHDSNGNLWSYYKGLPVQLVETIQNYATGKLVTE